MPCSHWTNKVVIYHFIAVLVTPFPTHKCEVLPGILWNNKAQIEWKMEMSSNMNFDDSLMYNL